MHRAPCNNHMPESAPHGCHGDVCAGLGIELHCTAVTAYPSNLRQVLKDLNQVMRRLGHGETMHLAAEVVLNSP